MLNSTTKAKFHLVLSMVIFGTIGIFKKNILLPSSLIAMTRGFTGTLFLLFIIVLTKKKLSMESLKINIFYLFLSGTLIGFNWIFLFEAYNYTSVAVATLCYYMSPVIVIVLSPVLFKEKLTAKKWICVLSAVIGMVFVSGVLNGGLSSVNEAKGVIFGLLSAFLYAMVIILNKKIKDISPYDKTIYQLGTAGIVSLPYTLLTENIGAIEFDITSIVLLAVVGIIHTGFAYYFYFGAISKLEAQTTALFSYIDPVVAIVLSALILSEKIGIFEIIGTLLILGSTIVCDLPVKRQKLSKKSKNH